MEVAILGCYLPYDEAQAVKDHVSLKNALPHANAAETYFGNDLQIHSPIL